MSRKSHTRRRSASVNGPVYKVEPIKQTFDLKPAGWLDNWAEETNEVLKILCPTAKTTRSDPNCTPRSDPCSTPRSCSNDPNGRLPTPKRSKSRSSSHNTNSLHRKIITPRSDPSSSPRSEERSSTPKRHRSRSRSIYKNNNSVTPISDSSSTPRSDSSSTPRSDFSSTPRSDFSSTPRSDSNSTPRSDSSSTPRSEMIIVSPRIKKQSSTPRASRSNSYKTPRLSQKSSTPRGTTRVNQ